MDYTDEDLQQRLQDEAAKRGVSYDQSDLEDVRRRDNSQAGLDIALRKYDTRANNIPNQDEHAAAAMPATPAQAWNASAQTQGRSNALYDELQKRITGANAPVDPNNPIIKGQVDTFRADQTRASRDYLSNIAERSGPLANIRGEQRMASEKLGQNVSGFQSELLAREQAAQREQASQALGLSSSMLTADQNRELQGALGFGDLNLRGELGRGQLALGNRGLDQNQDQFLRELALRQWDLGNQNDYRWAGL